MKTKEIFLHVSSRNREKGDSDRSKGGKKKSKADR